MREIIRHMLKYFQFAFMGPTARVTIISLSGVIIVFIIYLALKMVIKNFEPEVSGSIIQGLATVFTVGASLLFSAYTFNRSQRVTLRDEILKKRLELYNELYINCKNLLIITMYLLNKEFHDPNLEEQAKKGEEQAKKGFELRNEIFEFIDKNRFYLSEKVYELASEISHFASIVLNINKIDDERLKLRLISKLELDINLYMLKEGVKPPSLVRGAIWRKYYTPLIRQFENELNLKPIEEDIEKMYKVWF